MTSVPESQTIVSVVADVLRVGDVSSNQIHRCAPSQPIPGQPLGSLGRGRFTLLIRPLLVSVTGLRAKKTPTEREQLGAVSFSVRPALSVAWMMVQAKVGVAHRLDEVLAETTRKACFSNAHGQRTETGVLLRKRAGPGTA